MTNNTNDQERFVTPSRKSQSKHLPALKKVLASRSRMLVSFATLPLYMIGVWVLLSNAKSINGFLMFYCALWGVFAVDMMLRKCPACGEQFFVKEIIMSFRSKKCVHCGLDMQAIEAGNKREF
jgi:DNA-directed RNA polymerase subunit RPC12/RpoP